MLKRGVPETEVFLGEIAVVFRRLGMDPGLRRLDCESPRVQRLPDSEAVPISARGCKAHVRARLPQ